MRFKRRYFCVEIVFHDEAAAASKPQLNRLKHTHLSDTIHKSIEQLFGDYGMAVMMPSFSVIYFNSATNLAILRTARDLQKQFHTLLAFIQQIGTLNAAFNVVHVSGSIKKCKQFLIPHCQQKLANGVQDQAVVEVLQKLVQVCEVNDNMFNLK